MSAGIGTAVGRSIAPADKPRAEQSAVPDIRQVSGSDPSTGASVAASVTPAQGWVRLSVKVAGVAQGERCKLIAVSKSGRREVAGSWVVSEQGAVTGIEVAGAAAVPIDDLAALEVVTFADRRLVSVPVTV